VTPTEEDYRAAARRLYNKDGECEVDTDAPVSMQDPAEAEGAYVQAWVWVPADAITK
jgi:hypothetical protein